MDVEKIVRENIDRIIHLSLATSVDNKPWVCELHFAYDEGLNLYWRSLKSRRHSQEIMINQTVAGNIIDKHALNDEVVGLYFEGGAELIAPGAMQDLAAECLADRLKMSKKDILDEAKDENGHQFYKITVENWYIFGKFGADKGQKLKLEWNK